MFNLFKRVSTIMSSELNAMLDMAEDPVKMLDQFMRQMADEIREAEAAVAKQMANEKMLHKKLQDAEHLADKRQQQAEKALEADNEDLARRALQDKKQHTSQAATLKEAYSHAKRDTEDLRQKLQEMKSEYQEMDLKRDALKARAETAKTKTKINRTMSAIGSDDSKRGFARMEERVMRYEAEAETSQDMRHDDHKLDKELELLEENKVDDELAELKRKMGKA